MKVQHSIFTLIVVVVAFAAGEVPMSKRSLLPHNWPAKNSNQLSMARNPGGKPRTLVVQIRSDQPVPLVFKGRPAAHANGHLAHLHHHHAGSLHHYARPIQARPLKLSAPSYHLKAASMLSKPLQFRKPLKLKLANSKLKAAKLTYEKPFQYELPTTTTATVFADVKQQLPLETHAHFISDHFAPIHTIPAPNLAPLHDNHIHHEVEVQHHPKSHYQVTEDSTNDHTIFDPHSGVQKLYAPDPDPALPAGKVRVALESYNQPSNGQPLPVDVQSNYLPPVAQPLVQIVGAQAQSPQQPAPEIYPIQFAQPQPVQLQSLSPTYLISQSNNLYTQHQQQQLFKPAVAGYVNADLTQEVASNGQILQAAKDPHNNIHPVLDTAPQFAALIAAPALGEDHHHQPVSFRLPNAGAAAPAAAAPESGFVVSNFFGNAQDSSQLLQSYAEEERQHQQLEAERHYQQLQHEQKEQQLLLQQQKNHLIELQQQQLQQEQLQQEQQQQQQLYTQQLQQQQLQQQLQQLQQPQHPQQQQLIQPRQQQPVDSSVPGAFEGHRLNNYPLRIIVPDDESEATRVKKRADNLEKATTEDSPANDKGLN